MKLNCGSKIHHQANADSTVGTTYGRSSTERQKRTPAKALVQDQRQAQAESELQHDGDDRVQRVLIAVSRNTGSSSRYW